MLNNKFKSNLILLMVISLGFLGSDRVLPNPSPGVPAKDGQYPKSSTDEKFLKGETVKMKRKILDRLSVLYLMDGKTKESIELQKFGMNKKGSEESNISDIGQYGKELVGNLKSKGKAEEAINWEHQIMAFFDNKIETPEKEQPAKVKTAQPKTEPVVGKPLGKPSGETSKSKEMPVRKVAEVATVQPSPTAHSQMPVDGKSAKGKAELSPMAQKKVAEAKSQAAAKTATPKEYPVSRPLLPEPGKKIVREETPLQPVTITKSDPNKLKSFSTVTVTLNFRDVEIADVVRLLASKASLNVVSRNPISGKTTVNFDGIPVGTALDTILRTNDYSYDFKDGVIWVYKRGEEPLETRVFFIKNAYAADLAPLVKNSLQEVFVKREADTSGGSSSTGGQSGAGGSQGQQGGGGGASSAGSGGGSAAPAGGAADSGGSTGGGSMGGPGGGGASGGGDSSAPGGGAGGSGSGSGGGSTGGGGGSTGSGGGSTGGGTSGSGGGAGGGAGGSGGGSGAADASGGSASSSPTSAPVRWNVQVDDRSNSLIVTAARTKLDEIAALVAVFDVPMGGGRSTERIYKLKYIDRSTLEKAIKMVLPRFDTQKQLINVTRSDSSSGSSSGGSSSGDSAGASGS